MKKNSNYERVIPRDLFNEASLLKCIGKLVLEIEEGRLPWLTYGSDGGYFEIAQDDSDGSLEVVNVRFYYQDKTRLHFIRPLNARSGWPLYYAPADETVFDEFGNVNLTEQMVRENTQQE